MKFWTGLVVLVLLGSLTDGAHVVTMGQLSEKLAYMFSKSCQSPSEGLDLFRNELQECYEEKAIPEPDELKLTGVPLGLDGDVPDTALYASSYRDDYSHPGRGRLNEVKEGEFNGAWCSEVNNDLQFFQVDIGAVSTVTAIFTQGDHLELNWVQSYTLEISMDGFHWGCVFGSDGRVKVFDANKDSDSVKINVMHPYIVTRYIRIIPKSWTGHICLRVEIYVKEIIPREKDDTEPLKDIEAEVLEVHPKNTNSLIIKNDPSQVDTGVLPELYVDQRPAPYKSISFEHLKVEPDLYQVQPGGFGRHPLRPNIKLDPLYISGGGPVVDRTIAPGPYGIPLEVSTDYGIHTYPFEFEWCPPEGRFESNMYVEFAFSHPVSIRKFSTRGWQDSLERVSAYKVEYLLPKVHQWVWLHGKDENSIRIEGNTDNTGTRDHIYRPSIYSPRSRFYILDWNIRPCMTIILYMNSEPWETPHIVTGPIYNGGFIWWTWEEQEPEEGFTQEAYFKDELTLKSFEFESGSTVEGYKLQYFDSDEKWVEIFDDETAEFSNGDDPNVDGIVARGLRIIVLSWSSGSQLKANIKLEVYTETENEIEIIDILELSGHYMYYKWEDSNPVSESRVIFSFHDTVQVTRIETKGISGAWVSSYHLECRTHFAESGHYEVLRGNANDRDIVEHIFKEDMFCRYILITPVGTDRIGMEIFIYADRELEEAEAKISLLGSISGNMNGKWSPARFGDSPYVQFKSDNDFTPRSITLKPAEGSSVESFHIQVGIKGRNEEITFEPLLDGNDDNEVFSLGTTEFERRFKARGLKIFPILGDHNGNIGFEWDISFISEETINVVPTFHPAEDSTSTGEDTGFIHGGYRSTGREAGSHIVHVSFEEQQTVSSIRLKYFDPTHSSGSFNVKYKTGSSEDYILFLKDSEQNMIADGSGGAWEDLDLRDVTALEISLCSAGGEELVEYEYEIELDGDIGKFSTSADFNPEAAECTCPDGLEQVSCLVAPCQHADCDNPEAKCVNNYCGGCIADWYIEGRKFYDCNGPPE